MYHIARPLFLHCETPLHAGAGNDLGIVDLPIQREQHTNFPKIEGSSLKGALRERAEQQYSRNDKNIALTFGPEEGDLHAGALGFTDARLLLFPVKSMKGVFGWVTCPQVLKRFLQDLQTCQLSKGKLEMTLDDIPYPEIGKAAVSPNCALLMKQEKLILEEYSFTAQLEEYVSVVANWLLANLNTDDSWWQEKIGSSLVVLNDADFRDFVTLSTEVITRTKINNDTGTVADGALFTEEYLPTESILYSLVLAAPVFPVNEEKRNKLSNGESNAEAVMAWFETFLTQQAQNRLQLGANATIGKGLIRSSFLNP